MSTYSITITASSVYSSEVPELQLFSDGVLQQVSLVDQVAGAAGTFTYLVDFSAVSNPADVSLKFSDANTETGRSITIEQIEINGVDITSSTLILQNGASLDGSGYAVLDDEESVGVNTNSFAYAFGLIEPTLADFGAVTHTVTNAAGETLYASFGDDVVEGGAGDDVLVGYAGDDVIFGGAGNDLLTAQVGDDILVGGSGADTLNGGEGDDLLFGGIDIDLIQGGLDNDTIYGGTGNDNLYGNEGNDIINGGAHHDNIYGGEGDDIVYGGDDNDRIWGEDGDDILNGDAGNDRLVGGLGNDTINGGTGNDTIYGNEGNDIINGGDGVDLIGGDDGDDTIKGDAGDDHLYGGLGIDTLIGGIGNDRLVGNGGADILHGGDGNDTLYGNEDNDELNGGDGSDALGGGDGDDVLNGDAGNDFLYGNAGNDTIDGGEGNDRINAGTGDDTVHGGDGDDIVFGDTGNDTVYGGTGIDNIWGQAGNDTLHGGEGNDRVVGNKGEDIIYGDAGDDLLIGNEDNDQLHGGTGNDVIGGGDGDDTLNGNEDDDELYGGNGNDTLNGGTGNDLLRGNSGTDTLNGEDGNDVFIHDTEDTFNGGTGSDTITVFEGSTETIFLNTGLFSSIENIALNNFNDQVGANNLQVSLADIAAISSTNTLTITGDVGLDQVNFTLTGSEVRGSDIDIDGTTYAQFTGGGVTVNIELGLVYNGTILTSTDGGGGGGGSTSGDDVLIGTADADTISGLEGNDTIAGEDGNDILNGNEGNDNIFGGRGNDRINGGDGDDILHASLSGSIEQGVAPSTIEANNPGVFYSSATGNFYQFVNASVDPAAASAAAAAATIDGQAGHLATITTQEENDFINNLTGTSFAWIDGSDAATEGTFVWTEGPDAGTEIWANGSDVGNYENFYQGSPTSNSDNNDNIIFLGESYGGQWFAFRDNYDTSYVIEWEGGTLTNETIIGYDSRNETNYINGGDGDDSIFGAMGNDVLIGGNGADNIVGGAGNDQLHASGLSEAEVQNILTANPGVSYSEETGNFYQYVAGAFDYASAEAAASSTTLNGITGHLATVTSAGETDFLTNLTGTNYAWIDGSDAATEGTFTWTSGVDAGTEFWNNGSAVGNYENWFNGSPTTNSAADDHITFLGSTFGGQWYIFADTRQQGYVVEFDAANFDTETSANSLSGGRGEDSLYGSTGLDTFIFESDSAFNDVDTVYYFDNSEDILDISDILSGLSVDATNISDYVSLDVNAGVHVDVTGTGTFDNSTQIARFSATTSGIDDALTAYNEGELIV